MTAKHEAVINEALQLPVEERARLADELLASLEPEEDAGIDAAWALELDRRMQEVKEGRVATVSWSEVKAYAERHASKQS